MKVEEKKDKVYSLDPIEHGAFESYLLYLKYNPSPCTNCQNKECRGYGLFEKYGREDEYCSAGREWFEKGAIERCKMIHAPQDIKELLRKQYLLAFEEKQAGIAGAKRILAQYILDKSPVKIDNRINFHGRGLWDMGDIDDSYVEGSDE